MSRTHLKVTGADHRKFGQTQFEYDHQTACGYVRDNVTRNTKKVDCKLCIKSNPNKFRDTHTGDL